MKAVHTALAALLLGSAMSVSAQMPPPGAMPESSQRGGNPLFASMSPTGRAIMRAALKNADPHVAQVETAAARDRWLALLDAERLDPVALRRAMDDEREAANTAKARHQAALLAGLQQLSLADRRAFVADARAMRARVESRLAETKDRHRGPGDFNQPLPQ